MKLTDRIKWYWQEHTLEAILLVFIALWVVTLSIAAWKVTNKEQFYKDEILLMTDYIHKQENHMYNMSMVQDSVYASQSRIEDKIRTGK